MQVAAKRLELGCNGQQVRMVDLLRQVQLRSLPWASHDAYMHLFELIEPSNPLFPPLAKSL
jgi:hypothetical protein